MKQHIPNFVYQLFAWFEYVGDCLKPKISNKIVSLGGREVALVCPKKEHHPLRLENGGYFCCYCAKHYSKEKLKSPTLCSYCTHPLSFHRRSNYIARVWHCSGDNGWCGCGAFESKEENTHD